MRRIALALLILTGCASTLLEQRGWLEVRSANFTIYSDLPQARAVTFRPVAHPIFEQLDTDARAPAP